MTRLAEAGDHNALNILLGKPQQEDEWGKMIQCRYLWFAPLSVKEEKEVCVCARTCVSVCVCVCVCLSVCHTVETISVAQWR